MTTKPIVIYGASDDLVEIEGAFEEEFDCYGTWEGLVTSPDGEQLKVMLEFGYGWEISVKATSGDNNYPSWPLQFTERPDYEGDPALKIFAPEGTKVTEVR